MRTIEEQMNKAVRNEQNWRKDNTEVRIVDENIEVYLHGHNIATRTGHRWAINLCGWNSNTTRSRLSALLWEFCRTSVSTKQGQALLDGNPIPSDAWVTVP